MKKVLLGITGLLVLGAVVGWFTVGKGLYGRMQRVGRDTLPADYALQDDSKVRAPQPEPHVVQPKNAKGNVYWGDTHVHTHESFDAKIFGTTVTVEDAYRFARGEALRSEGGEKMQLSRPLDFVAITDHAEGFGLRTRCNEPDLTWFESLNCYLLETANPMAFVLLRAVASRNQPTAEPDREAPAGVYQQEVRPPRDRSFWPICGKGEGGVERCERDARTDWARYIALADAHNEPGVLTTFAAYEYSPTLPDAGKHHRNVLFNGNDLPEHAISSHGRGQCNRPLARAGGHLHGRLRLPHDPPQHEQVLGARSTAGTPGMAASYDEEKWRLRKRREPLAEIYQVKGASECALGRRCHRRGVCVQPGSGTV